MKIKDISKNIVRIVMLLALFGINIVCINTFADAASAKCMTIKPSKTYKRYDITGDGKVDTIRSEMVGKDWKTNFEVYVNEKKALDIKVNHYYEEHAKCQIISLANGKKYLYVYLPSDNGDGPVSLYTYKNGKLVKEINLIKPFDEIMGYHSGAVVKKVSGNKIIFKMNSMSYALGALHFESVYQYKKDKLVLTGKIHKLLYYYSGNNKPKLGVLTTSIPIQLYQDKTAKQKVKKLKKRTKLKATKCYISKKRVTYYVKTEDGTKGWFVSPSSESTLHGKPFDEIMYVG